MKNKIEIEILFRDQYYNADVEYEFVPAEPENNYPCGVELVCVSIGGIDILDSMTDCDINDVSRSCIVNHLGIAEAAREMWL